MSTTWAPTPVLFSPAKHSHLLPSIVKIHRDCVKQDGLLATIIDVDHPTKLLDYWNALIPEVEKETREILLQFTDDSEKELAGVVSLYMPNSETGPFRSFVEKLMVSPDHRRKGYARSLMDEFERLAVERGRGMIVL